jgi:WD40 repeat protein
VPAPHWPIPGVDAGNTATPTPGPDGVIDVAWAWGSLVWPPDGTTLAAAAESQQSGEGQIHLFDRTGHPVGAVPGWRAVWTDDHDLMTLVSNADGVGGSSAWRWSSDGRASALVAANAGDLLGNSLGQVAIAFWSTDSAAATFRVWTHEGLSVALPGSPAAWSPDGRTLAVLRDAGTAFGPTSSGVVLAATGSVPPVWLQVLDVSNLRPLAGLPASPFDPRTPVLFDPSGTLIATSGFVFDLADGVANARPPSSEAVAWGTDGRLIVASFADHTIAAWDPTTHTLSASFSPGTRLPTPDHQIVTVPPRTGEWPALVTPGVVSPDGALRAWDPPANGLGNTPLRLVPTAAAGP